MKYIVLETYTF